MKYIVGLDLGTSNSSVCYAPLLDQTTPTMLPFEKGNLCPSLVFYNRNGRISVGHTAAVMYKQNDGLVNYMKRILGKKYTDVDDATKKSCKSEIVIGKKGYAAFKVRDRVMLPEEVFTEVVKYIHKFLISKIEDGEVAKVVVTVPANYNQGQLTLTKKIVQDGGFDCEIQLLPEPVAACLSYDVGSMYTNGYFVVVDSGGGTSDVALVKLDNVDHFDVVDTVGNDIAGSTFDVLILEWLKKEYQEKFNTPLAPDKKDKRFEKALKILLDECRQAKQQLSTQLDVEIDLDNYFTQVSGYEGADEIAMNLDDCGVAVDNSFALSCTKLNSIIEYYVDEIMDLVNNVLTRNHISKDEIIKVLLVGGSSRLLLIHDKLKSMFGASRLCEAVNPDECVANGACLSVLKHDIFTNRLHYNIYNCEGRPCPENYKLLLKSRTTLPCSITKQYTIPGNNIGFFSDCIYQGETPRTARKLAPLIVTGFSDEPEDITVTYKISVNKESILSYSVTEDATGEVLVENKVVAN